ncbi:hypothetical protein [Geomicrobium sp. JCM 19038]|uniref:hypothetical protein n=1 Tax=Geomicrobium sp. JCM 19038 TaxID=1460635 RepID=UPI00045F43BA|nr:hypothetical protein [Geomicrobium sp. JCM 19038]GAK09475.1 hypothetical protein JCM19038_3314 [Geomicrobium sp. JCM 19038]
MKLHAKNIALMAGAKGDEIPKIASLLLKDEKYRVDVAKHHLKSIRGEKAHE